MPSEVRRFDKHLTSKEAELLAVLTETTGRLIGIDIIAFIGAPNGGRAQLVVLPDVEARGVIAALARADWAQADKLMSSLTDEPAL